MTTSGLRPGAAERLATIDGILEHAYGTPESHLDNKDDPLDEAIYIILSFQTDLARFRSTWSRLREAYPDWAALERARIRDIAAILREGGLQRQKARTLRQLLARVRRVAGHLSLDVLRTMSDGDAERLLTQLPGLSWKAARCILLYSLRRDAFPVDSNIFRILKRTGTLSRRAVYRRRSLHDALQLVVPPSRRRPLHVNLVVHGQRVCLPRVPQCSRCPLLATCPKVGVHIDAIQSVPAYPRHGRTRLPLTRANEEARR